MKLSKKILFQDILFSQTILFQTIQFSIIFLYAQLNVYFKQNFHILKITESEKIANTWIWTELKKKKAVEY